MGPESLVCTHTHTHTRREKKNGPKITGVATFRQETPARTEMYGLPTVGLAH